MSEATVSRTLRRAVALRARYCCEYCGSQEAYSPDRFSVEHIQPRSQGGPTDLDNLALSCQGCNGHKFTRTESVDPETGATVPLFHPRRDRWSEHFAWNLDFTLMIGITSSGRATVVALRLNRDSLINMRRVLVQAGFHPHGNFTME